MRTTIVLDDDLLAKAQAFTGVKDWREGKDLFGKHSGP
jgi:Arc/MetJ family transcription regulator